MISTLIQNHLTNPIYENTVHESYFTLIVTVISIANIFTFIILEIIKIRSSRILYGIDSGNFFRFFELVLFYSPAVIIFVIPTFVIAAFGNLKQGREYVVAMKDVKDIHIADGDVIVVVDNI